MQGKSRRFSIFHFSKMVPVSVSLWNQVAVWATVLHNRTSNLCNFYMSKLVLLETSVIYDPIFNYLNISLNPSTY